MRASRKLRGACLPAARGAQGRGGPQLASVAERRRAWPGRVPGGAALPAVPRQLLPRFAAWAGAAPPAHAPSTTGRFSTPARARQPVRGNRPPTRSMAGDPGACAGAARGGRATFKIKLFGLRRAGPRLWLRQQVAHARQPEAARSLPFCGARRAGTRGPSARVRPSPSDAAPGLAGCREERRRPQFLPPVAAAFPAPCHTPRSSSCLLLSPDLSLQGHAGGGDALETRLRAPQERSGQKD